MPVYSFHDTETEEEFELQMSYDELKQFLEDNSKVNQTFRLNIGDPVGMGITRPPADFQKYVLGRVKEAVPGAQKHTIEKRWHIPKEV